MALYSTGIGVCVCRCVFTPPRQGTRCAIVSTKILHFLGRIEVLDPAARGMASSTAQARCEESGPGVILVAGVPGQGLDAAFGICGSNYGVRPNGAKEPYADSQVPKTDLGSDSGNS